MFDKIKPHNKYFSRITTPYKRDDIGFGYIYIPDNINREKFIQTCYSTNIVSIFTDEGEYIREIRIDKNRLQEINFPVNSNEYGSPVVFVNLKKYNIPIIIGVLEFPDNFSDLKENFFKLIRITEDSTVSISGDAEEASIDISILTKNEKGSVLNINVKDPNDNSVVNLNVNGVVKIDASKGIIVSDANENEFTLDELGLKFKSSSGLIEILKNGEIKLNGGDIENMVLGQQLLLILTRILSSIMSATFGVVSVGEPTSTAINLVEFELIKSDLDKILSKNIFVK